MGKGFHVVNTRAYERNVSGFSNFVGISQALDCGSSYHIDVRVVVGDNPKIRSSNPQFRL